MQGGANRGLRPAPLRVGRRKVVSIAAFADAKQFDGGGFPGEQKDASGFANIDSFAVYAHRLTAVSRDGFEGDEALDGRSTERVGADDQHRIGETLSQ